MKYPPHLWVPVLVLTCVCAGFPPRVYCKASPSSSASERDGPPQAGATVTIPGPLRSFLRMSGISQKASPEEVIPLLARNIFLMGFQGGGITRQPTEFLLLLRRYVQQARELAALAGPDGVIHVFGCDDAKRLLEILGYSTSPTCGGRGTILVTENSRRAFLTIDSGFPLPDLERSLRENKPFDHPFPNSQVPILLTESDWTGAGIEGKKDNGKGGLIDALLHDPSLARLYYAWVHMDPETQAALQQSPGLRNLVPLAASLDFYGSYIQVRSGRVLVPGGSGADSEWRDLVGASPQSPGEFVPRLLERDESWLAAYYDSLSRVPPDQQAHFIESGRLRHCYEALRGKVMIPSATASVFRPDPDLLLLITRVNWEPNGDPHVPGNLDAWNHVLRQKGNAEIAPGKKVGIKNVNNSEGLLEAMIALSRADVGEGLPQAFLMLTEIDAKRPAARRLGAQTVELMASHFAEFRDQYLIFSEFPNLSDASIVAFLTTAQSLGKIPDFALRGNAMGIFEANIGLWQILARQGQVSRSEQDRSFQELIKPFAHVSSSTQLFDAGSSSLGQLLHAAGSDSTGSQEEIVNLIAGPRQTYPEGQRIHAEMADRIQTVLDDQRLVPLDALLHLGDGLRELAQGTSPSNSLVPLAEQLKEFQMPRPIFTSGERVEFTAGTYNNQHTESEMRTDLAKLLNSRPSSAQLEEARGQLAPFLRDTLVGLNYAYYEPPGAQTLHNNPLLIRSHDFSGDKQTSTAPEFSLWRTPSLLGVGSPAGGGAHLFGSLAELPYVLSRMEQDFISPQNVQALIWTDLVPSILTDAVLPRWWNVSPSEMHAVALYQRAGEELLAASEENEALRGKVMSILSDRMPPQRSAQLEESLREKRTPEVTSQTTPADTFYLAVEFHERFPGEANSWGPAARELAEMYSQTPEQLSWDRISHDFGIPHPVLAHTYGRELLSLRPFPMFQGYSSQLLAETWDSTNLYWARLADEAGYPPVMLNRLAPELTVRMVAKIFATDLNDWPALLRAMRETGEEFRQGKYASLPSNGAAPQP